MTKTSDISVPRLPGVFLIETPLQALNAIEACYAFGIAPKDAIIVFSEFGSEINNRQTRRILAGEEWGTVHVVPYHGATLLAWIGRMRSLNAIARGLPAVEHLFLGDYAYELERHFAWRLQPRSIVMLDDGNGTIEVALTRADPGGPQYFRGQKPWKLRLKRCLGMRDHSPQRLTYFTIYDIEVEPGSQCIPNRYARLRTRGAAEVDDSTLFFLGTSMGERESVSDDQYIAWVSRAMNRLTNYSRRYYLPHRHESAARLERITRELGLHIKRFDAPIEYGLCCLSELLPGVVAGFGSTAFDTLQILFGGRIKLKVFCLDLPAYHETYAYYRRCYRAPDFELVSDF